MQGFLGKIPGHGDFVTRNLPSEFTDAWDDWLQHAVAASKTELADTWLDTYLTSPIWRFVLLPGVCGRSGWAGILVPSVDRVGRYFPLTVAAALDDDVQPFRIAVSAGSWFDAAEALALEVLEQERVTADELADSVSALDAAALTRRCDPAPRLAGGEWGLRVMCGAEHALAQAVSHELVTFQVGLYSLWWNNGSEDFEPMALVAPSLPDPACFARLLEGSWGAACEAQGLSNARAEPVVAEEAPHG